jgi:hypothetical protein
VANALERWQIDHDCWVVKAMLPVGDLWFTGNDNAHKHRENANLEHPVQHSSREDFQTHGFCKEGRAMKTLLQDIRASTLST